MKRGWSGKEAAMIDARTVSESSPIAQAMLQGENIMARAAAEHFQAFVMQMREKVGVDEIRLNEPYLPFVLVRGELRYLLRLAKLEQRLGAVKSAFAFDCCGLERKEEDAPIQQQIERETNRSVIALKQELDGKRQQAFGITRYIWRTDGSACPICDPFDGQIFEWGKGISHDRSQ